MKIVVKRTGGFAGLSEDVAAVDTAQLGTTVSQPVEQMVESIRFFDLPAFVSGGTIGADLFQYDITITEGDRQHSVAFVDDESPETAPLRRLVEAFIHLGR